MRATLVRDDSILNYASTLNQLVQEQDAKNWDLGANACKDLADILRNGKYKTND